MTTTILGKEVAEETAKTDSEILTWEPFLMA